MAKPRFGKPYAYVTWLTSLLAGESQCEYAPWFKAHFKYQKRVDPDFHLAAWSAQHAEMVKATADQMVTDGWTVTTEDENGFKLDGQAAVVSGKPDLVGTRDGMALILDCKTGRQRNSDWWQVLLYLWANRYARRWPEAVTGQVVYRAAAATVQSEELTSERAGAIVALIRRVSQHESPEPKPSPGECRFCDLTREDCPSRIDAGVATTATTDF